MTITFICLIAAISLSIYLFRAWRTTAPRSRVEEKSNMLGDPKSPDEPKRAHDLTNHDTKDSTANTHDIQYNQPMSAFDPITCETTLMKTAQRNLDKKQIEALKNAGALELTARDTKGRTAIMHAIEHDQIDNVRAFLENKSTDIFTANTIGMDAFSFALERGNPKMIQAMLAYAQHDIQKTSGILKRLRGVRALKKKTLRNATAMMKKAALKAEILDLNAQLNIEKNHQHKSQDNLMFARHRLHMIPAQLKKPAQDIVRLKEAKETSQSKHQKAKKVYESLLDAQQQKQSITPHENRNATNLATPHICTFEDFIRKTKQHANNLLQRMSHSPQDQTADTMTKALKDSHQKMVSLKQESDRIERELDATLAGQETLKSSLTDAKSNVERLEASIQVRLNKIKSIQEKLGRYQGKIARDTHVTDIAFNDAQRRVKRLDKAHTQINADIQQHKQKWKQIQTTITEHFNQAVELRLLDKVEILLRYTNAYKLEPATLYDYYIDTSYTRPKLSAHLLESGAIDTEKLHQKLEKLPYPRLPKMVLAKFEASQNKGLPEIKHTPDAKLGA